MKQHPDSVSRDLDDEVAEAIEHQYARKLIKRSTGSDGSLAEQRRRLATSKPTDDSFDAEMEQLREKSGF
jgi:hypothetical protein